MIEKTIIVKTNKTNCQKRQHISWTCMNPKPHILVNENEITSIKLKSNICFLWLVLQHICYVCIYIIWSFIYIENLILSTTINHSIISERKPVRCTSPSSYLKSCIDAWKCIFFDFIYFDPNTMFIINILQPHKNCGEKI